jgi:hypothetical protein
MTGYGQTRLGQCNVWFMAVLSLLVFAIFNYLKRADFFITICLFVFWHLGYFSVVMALL